MEHNVLFVCFPVCERAFRRLRLELDAQQRRVEMLYYATLLTDNQLYTILSLRDRQPHQSEMSTWELEPVV
jgi:hypothetical protein